MRTPHGAKALVTQVREGLRRKPDSKAGLETGVPVGDPDGFGRYRSIQFDKTASKVIVAAQAALESDARIKSVEVDKGVATVTFVASSAAENKAPFDLAEVEPEEPVE